MNVAYGRQTATLEISNAEWEVLKALVLSGRPYQMGPSDLAKRRLGLTPAAMAHKWLEAMRLASVFEEELLQDLSVEERGRLGEMLIGLLRRVEAAQPDAGGRLTGLD